MPENNPKDSKEGKPKLSRKERQERAKAKANQEVKTGAPAVSKTIAKEKVQVKDSGELVKKIESERSVEKTITASSSTEASQKVKQARSQRYEKLEQNMRNFDRIVYPYESKNIHLHPSVIAVGLKMNQGIIRGSAKRCIAMLLTFKKMARDLIVPTRKDYLHAFQSNLDSSVHFLEQCRQLSVSMTNAIRFIKANSTNLPQSEHESRRFVEDLIDKYISEYQLAMKAIVRDGSFKIAADNEVILTYGDSILVRNLLMKAHFDRKKFRVIVADSRPRFLGRPMAEFLVNNGIQVSYVHINAIAYVMKEVTKVLIGAHAMLSNGYVIASVGTSQIALVAQAFNVPVLVCCETLNFSERAHIDSLVFNEKGPIEDFFKEAEEEKSKLKSFINLECKEVAKPVSDKNVPSDKDLDFSKHQTPQLDIWNYFYDITPSSLISLVITEKGFLPCSSVSAVIRKNCGRF